MATKRIKITDDRQGNTFRTGINGKYFDLAVNQEIEVSEAMADHLRTVGARFEEVETKGANSSKEGSGVELAPIGPHDVRAPGTDAKSLNDRVRPSGALAGDQPGDVTSAGAIVRHPEGVTSIGHVIEDDAKASDLRVAGERRTPKLASVAELAGEGEQGTPVAEPQPSAPSHKETAAEKAEAEAQKARESGASEPVNLHPEATAKASKAKK